MYVFFFFQAEDGIRDVAVTGVQTCALPIFVLASAGNPRWIAADLLAQAEHAPDAGSFLVTTSTGLARQVQTEVTRQLHELPATNPAQISMKRTGAILVAPSFHAACEFVDRFAPEHLSLPHKGEALLKQIH